MFWNKKKDEDILAELEKPIYFSKKGDYDKYAKCVNCGEVNEKHKLKGGDVCCTKCGYEDFILVTARPKLRKFNTSGLLMPLGAWEICGYEILGGLNV